VRLLDHMIILFLIFWGTSILFSIVAILYVNSLSIIYSKHKIFKIIFVPQESPKLLSTSVMDSVNREINHKQPLCTHTHLCMCVCVCVCVCKTDRQTLPVWRQAYPEWRIWLLIWAGFISCKASLLVLNSSACCLPVKHFIFPSDPNDSVAKYFWL